MKNKNIPSITLAALALLTLFIASPVRAAFREDTRQALQVATRQAIQDLKTTGNIPAGRTIAVIPPTDDAALYLYGLLRAELTRAGFTVTESRDSAFWEEIFASVEWSERRGDIMDRSTINRFGQLLGAQALLYGTIRETTEARTHVYVEIELHISSVETAQHLWGGFFSHRFYQPGEAEGLIELDHTTRQLLQNTINRALEDVEKSDKLGTVRTIAIAPFGGDIEGYALGQTLAALSRTRLVPRELDIRTQAELRRILRDTPDRADAMLIGSIRDLSLTREETGILETTSRYRTEIQLSIIAPTTGDILWSTSTHGEEIEVETPDKMNILLQYLWDHPIVVLATIGGILLFLLILIMIKAATRVK